MKYRSDSLRLKNYNYGSAGYYFVTICTKNRKNFFGKIEKDRMELNELGKIVEKFWYEIPNHFENITVDEFIVMPNHVHGIIVIKNQLVATPNLGVVTEKQWKSGTLGVVINQFKRICTINVRKFMSDFSWQPRFYEHVIRNEKSLFEIRKYIRFNAQKWREDENNLDA